MATAASVGLIHTLVGPDHYVPFIAMASARKWSLRRTLGITAVCGVGHVTSSLLLAVLGIMFGRTLRELQWFDGIRNGIAGWLLLGFGLAYMLWGLRQTIRNRPHEHPHLHAGNLLHEHSHHHRGEHTHVHTDLTQKQSLQRITPWILFTIFIFGPCEALIPILMVPAMGGHWWWVGLIVLNFGLITVTTMLVLVFIGYRGTTRQPFRQFERFGHALAGMALVVCGMAIQFGL